MPSQHRTAATLVPANGVELEVITAGTAEPVLLIQTALLAEEFAPLTREPALRDRYQLIRYHRRGYGGSSPVHGPGSIERDAADCRALMTALNQGGASGTELPLKERPTTLRRHPIQPLRILGLT